MSDKTKEDGDDPRTETAAGFRLRPERPRVMRLSRKVLASLAGVARVAILGSVIWALGGNKRNQPGAQELFNTDNKTTPDGLASLPKDYTSLPQNVSRIVPGDGILGTKRMCVRQNDEHAFAPQPNDVAIARNGLSHEERNVELPGA